jgi:glutamyl-tRNA synthetase
MHIGNLRSALYEYLIARSMGGAFILRIEDTDRGRYLEGAVEVIYRNLELCGLTHDEGPDIGGPNGPYTQSERLPLYRKYAQELVLQGHAYPCFCASAGSSETDEGEEAASFGYDRRCRGIDPELARERMASGETYAIRQKMPLEGSTSFSDEVYGTITVNNRELEDQILLKSDGFPTYNFANVIDDHLMEITHVVRGSEYLSSTPKYCLLYEALGWEIPRFVHLPLIVGEDGRKLSKRHGSTGFDDLIKEGYLPEAIVNMIAFLGWSPGGETRELFSLKELEQAFHIGGINKAPAVFSYHKLDWMNEQHIRAMPFDRWKKEVKELADPAFKGRPYALDQLAQVLQPRVTKLSDIPSMIRFLTERLPLSRDLFFNKRAKLDADRAAVILRAICPGLQALDDWTEAGLHDLLEKTGQALDIKKGQLMGSLRAGLAAQQVTPGGAIETALILGRRESLERLDRVLKFLDEA